MNINFGLLKDYRKRDKERVIHNAIKSILQWKERIERQ
jgi:hypothetical protein